METKEIIRYRRKELGLTMKDVGDACSVSEATVSRWESGEIENMRRDKIQALANILRLDPSVIMGWKEVEFPVPLENPLEKEEQELVEAYRRAPEGRRESVRALLGH